MKDYELLEYPKTYKQIYKSLKAQTTKLEKVRNRIVKALGAEPFVFTDLDVIISELAEIEFNLESRIYGDD